MLIAAGYEIPTVEPGWKDASGKESSEDLAVALALLEFVADQGLDPNAATPQEVCDALVKASGGAPTNGKPVPSNGNGDGLSTGAKVAIGVGGLALVGGIAYLALK
jgi:hypothetical protein